uniref:Uncharacterized protein n=1 Tax=Rheinheimera sp. BAL341 TaxID=1708203 RepID=A0A486XQG4_9GAMM
MFADNGFFIACETSILHINSANKPTLIFKRKKTVDAIGAVLDNTRHLLRSS